MQTFQQHPDPSGIYSLDHISQFRTLKPSRAEKYPAGLTFHKNILQLLDTLQCPLLLLPSANATTIVERIGFFSDIRFIDIPGLQLLAKTAKVLCARVTIFNVSEPGLPEMDPAYAINYFSGQLMPLAGDLQTDLISLKETDAGSLRNAIKQQKIDMVAAMQRSKELLYRLVS